MSDFGEIIAIVIFIIIGLLNSFSNKKKKAAEKAKQQKSSTNPQMVKKEVVAAQRKEQNIFDIFSEKVENKFSEVDEYFKKLESEMNKKEPPKREAPKKIVREFRAPTPTKELKRTHVAKKEIQSCDKQNKRVSQIKRKLKNPKTIKQFIIANEILNKPKALQ